MSSKLQCAISNQLRARDHYSGGQLEALEEYVDDLQETLASLLTLLQSRGFIEKGKLIDMLPNNHTSYVREVLDNE